MKQVYGRVADLETFIEAMQSLELAGRTGTDLATGVTAAAVFVPDEIVDKVKPFFEGEPVVVSALAPPEQR